MYDNFNFGGYIQLKTPITHSGNLIAYYRGIIGTYTDTNEYAFGIELTGERGIIYAVRVAQIYTMQLPNAQDSIPFDASQLPF